MGAEQGPIHGRAVSRGTAEEKPGGKARNRLGFVTGACRGGFGDAGMCQARLGCSHSFPCAPGTGTCAQLCQLSSIGPAGQTKRFFALSPCPTEHMGLTRARWNTVQGVQTALGGPQG